MPVRSLVAVPILLSTLLLSGCRPFQPVVALGSCTLGLPGDVSDEEKIRAVVRTEGELVVEQNIDSLMALWGNGSQVVDAKNTPNESSDDQIWLDKDAVRHRYVRTVFPGAPAAATPANLVVFIDGDHATVTATTHIGSEVSPAGDRWLLQRQRDCWVIERLTYNLEHKP
jgi:hypothetical protein